MISALAELTGTRVSAPPVPAPVRTAMPCPSSTLRSSRASRSADRYSGLTRTERLLRSAPRSRVTTASMAAATESPGPLIISALASTSSVKVTAWLPNRARTWAAIWPGWAKSSGMATNTVRWPTGTSGEERVVIRVAVSPPSADAPWKRRTPPSSLMRTP